MEWKVLEPVSQFFFGAFFFFFFVIVCGAFAGLGGDEAAALAAAFLSLLRLKKPMTLPEALLVKTCPP
jgi:hypothetical protein